MRQEVVYFRELFMTLTLTFDLYVGGRGILSEFYSLYLVHIAYIY